MVNIYVPIEALSTSQCSVELEISFFASRSLFLGSWVKESFCRFLRLWIFRLFQALCLQVHFVQGFLTVRCAVYLCLVDGRTSCSLLERLHSLMETQ